mgnify:CR=1 FL=1
MRPDGRQPHEVRPITIEPDFIRYPEGSVLYRAGDTMVLCNASVLDRTAPFLRGASLLVAADCVPVAYAGFHSELLRDHVVIYEGALASLKRFKDDAAEVRQGFDCGIGLDRYQDIKEGDIIEAYKMIEIAPEL